jgi:hypothetical protein
MNDPSTAAPAGVKRKLDDIGETDETNAKRAHLGSDSEAKCSAGSRRLRFGKPQLLLLDRLETFILNLEHDVVTDKRVVPDSVELVRGQQVPFTAERHTASDKPAQVAARWDDQFRMDGGLLCYARTTLMWVVVPCRLR